MKKMAALILAGLLAWGGTGVFGAKPVMASETSVWRDMEAETAAESLKALNLFAGTQNGFELYRTGTRAEGAVMLVRLLGREKDAAARQSAHPFLDVPAWADGQVGLLYRAGLTSGVSNHAFGSAQAITGRQFGAFVLRALGYTDTTDDAYARAIPLLIQLGLLDASDPVATDPDKPVLRGSMVKMASRALAVAQKGQARTLMDVLVINGQVPVQAAGKWLAASLAPKLLGKLDDPYEQIKVFHDWLVNRNTYGYLTAKDDPTRALSSEGYTALSLGTGVCGAYAKAMQMLCGASGLPCGLVQGEALGAAGSWTGHAWNQVMVDGQWYQMDVTFDDPIGVTVLRYNYFNVTDADLSKDHRWDRSVFPACTAVAANWFVRTGRNVSTWPEFENSLSRMVETRGTEITLRVQPFQNSLYNETAIRTVLTGSGTVSGYTHSLDRVMGVIRVTNVKYFKEPVG